MTASRGAQAFVVTAAVAAVSMVFFATRPSMKAPGGTLQYLEELHVAEAALNEDVLKARQGLLTNYDPLVAHLHRGRRALSALEAEAVLETASGAPEFDRYVAELETVHRRRAVLLEDFKSDHAVLRNSVHYFLLLSERLLRPDAPDEALSPAVVHEVHDLRDHVATYLATAERGNLREAAQLAARLQRRKAVSPLEAPLTLLARHATAILRHRQRVDQETAAFLALTMSPTLAEVRRLHVARQAERAARVEMTRTALYGAALFLLAWLGFILFRLRVASTALQQAKERAEAADRAKTSFLAHVSHELRTPLNAVLGFSSAISAQMFGPIDNRYVEYSNDIHRAGDHLLQLINDLLDLSVVESEQLALSVGRVDVAEVVSASLKLVEERAAAAGLALTSHVADDVPMLLADERRVKQILINLLTNAIKYTPGAGCVTVHAGCRDGVVEISVADTGPGIPASEIDDVMTPFGRSRDARVRRAEGIGLGLPLARRLAELHGGSLRLESELGRGTIVTIALPAAPPRAAGGLDPPISNSRS